MPEESPPRWRPSSRVVAVLAALFVTGVVFSEALRTAFFLFFFAFLLALLLDYPVRLLAKVMPRGVAAGLVLLAILGGVAAGVRFAVPPLITQASRVAEQAPRAIDRAKEGWDRIREDAPVEIPSGEQLEQEVSPEGGGLWRVLPFAGATLSALGMVVLLLILATFMVSNPKGYAEGAVWLFPKGQEKYVREYLERVVVTMRGWLYAQLLLMTFVGVATAIGLFAIGVNGWPVLAVVNFFCEFVPYLGPFVGAAPGVAVAFAESTSKGAYAAAVYFGVQQLEGYLVSPLVMKHQVRIPPPLLLLWQVVMGIAFGIVGIVAATPILALLRVTVDYFWVERTLGKDAEQPA